MLARLLRPFAYLPLRVLHAIGVGLSWLIYWLSPRYRQALANNIRQSGLCQHGADYTRFIRVSIAEHGRGGVELLYAWCRSFPHLTKQVHQLSGGHYITEAIAAQKPIIFVLPHLGSFEICGMYLSTLLPFPTTALYRPPKIKSLERLMQQGRNRYTGHTAPANVTGIRTLLKALKKKQAVIILPDQAPSAGEGVWAPFFGRPAYTMTLLPRLAQNTAATLLMCFAARLPRGQGFHVHITPIDQAFGADKVANATIVNRNIEKLIKLAPEQYLWGYQRYKHPAGAPPC